MVERRGELREALELQGPAALAINQGTPTKHKRTPLKGVQMT